MSWNEFEALSLEIAKYVKASKKTYDLFVCVSRGGLLLGKILSEVLDTPLGIISAKYVNNTYFIDKVVSTTTPLSGKILLIDDVFEENGLKIKDFILKNKGVVEVDLASIFYRSKQKKFKPNYYLNEIKEDIWVSFPYQSKHLKKEFKD